MFQSLKRKWNIASNFQLAMIFLAFSFAGISITQVRLPLFALFGIQPDTPFWIKTLVYLVSIFPLYQVFLLLFGTLLGQFRFFWEKEKAMGRWILRRLTGTTTAV